MSILRNSRKALCCAFAASVAIHPTVAFANPGNAHSVSGNGKASVVDPIGIHTVADIRFGRIIRPTTAGTLTIDQNGVVTESGGVTGNAVSTPQIANGRGRGAFAVFGDPNRWVIMRLPPQTTVSNGNATMTVDQFRANTGLFGVRRTDNTGYADIVIGARLNVGANQQVGTYSGTYPVTVLYL